MSDDAWVDLVTALAVLAKHKIGPFPLHCEHDELTVMSDPMKFSDEELTQLEEWGFIPTDDECFKSYRFGSA